MLAKIKCHRNLAKSLRYNEQKIVAGKADCIAMVNFIKNDTSITPGEKMDRFRQRTSLHTMCESNAVHISLNFSTNDRLTDEKMTQLADHYMKAIGFEHQPYLVYRHTDAYQPHMHIVSTNITAEGKRIDLNPIIRSLSRETTAEMERVFNLTANIKATDAAAYERLTAFQVDMSEGGIQQRISDVLNAVLPHYNFISFAEVRAALRLYHVEANQGEPGSRLHTMKGLLYHALDGNGKKASAPLKASCFLLRPTQKYLERRYEENLAARKEMGIHVESYVGWIMEGTKPTWEKFGEAMAREGISVVTQKDKDTGKDSVFFVHHAQKFVIAGESLGEEFSLRSLKERCSMEEQQDQRLGQRHRLRL